MPSTDIIHVLPEVVANQIAAGEVVQQPSSVVKELVENAIDAGATQIDIKIKDGGRTLIQVSDNGKGMSANDAVCCFERHATSKINQAEDLFSLRTMGFRGEALASIAAVAHVEMRTKRAEDELGSMVCMAGGTLQSQELVCCNNGTMIQVKDLFYNIPARRKFLKSNESEFRNIVNTFEQIALIYPQINFKLYHNDGLIYQLEEGNMRQRIDALFSKKGTQSLLKIEVDTLLIKITGYVGLPQHAVKRGAPQFFFVNGRYIRHNYFNKAVQIAYDKLIAADLRPSYFICFEVDPARIDVNIHPTKTEVKFENEQEIFPIITAAIREALGKANVVQPIDFDQTNAPDIPALQPSECDCIIEPNVGFDPMYNPFDQCPAAGEHTHYSSEKQSYTSEKTPQSWDKLYQSPLAEPAAQQALWKNEPNSKLAWLRHGNWLVVSLPQGLAVLNPRRAHYEILRQQYLSQHSLGQTSTQQQLFPQLLELSAAENSLMHEYHTALEEAGFAFEDFGKNAYRIVGIPSGISTDHPDELVCELLHELAENGGDNAQKRHQLMARNIARKTCIEPGKLLSNTEAETLIRQWQEIGCPLKTGDGKLIAQLFNNDTCSQWFH